MRMFFLWLKSSIMELFTRCFCKKSSDAQFKPCPECGELPIISIHHDTLNIHCKKGCHGVSMSDFDGNRLSWAEIVWQWNNIVDTYRKHSSKQTLDKLKDGNDTTYGFGKYFIEHPTSEVNNHEGNNY